ncbi:LacI family DNA-binding transcriptional regulator [Phenylobacterium sp. Root700]|uniref:LacI family DNA-binding transcriptional regulator n=1 Tax=Phenylobacterium sp. Root700 TaxID=1736591 RepID=UPI0006F1F6F3|nr:LacI family DNA-binding transcriptional regulator [Phenylobacterium sp. Root700]KRB44478.1 transcriptional regulator [Phenylobacterium sp. Root700]
MTRQPTIKDVATKAEVSFKTVSRVLNGEPHVREEVRDRVLAAAAALNYRPNIAARGLIGGQSRLIGFLYDNPNYSYVTEAEIGALLRCKQSGYHLAIEPVDSQGDVGGQIEQILASLRLDGVILTPPISDDPAALAALDRLGVRHVRIAPHADRDLSPCVFIDDDEAAFAMTRSLLDLGHRTIGFVLGHPDHGASPQRLAGFRRAMREQGLSPDANHLIQGYFTFESGMEAGLRLLTLPHRPTAIFAANDKMALGVMAAARDLGLTIPGDVSIAGFDDTHAAQMGWPSLTTVHQPVEDMCAAAAGMLISLAAGEPLREAARKLDFQIMPRASTARI